jgi:hypothetical protein
MPSQDPGPRSFTARGGEWPYADQWEVASVSVGNGLTRSVEPKRAKGFRVLSVTYRWLALSFRQRSTW